MAAEPEFWVEAVVRLDWGFGCRGKLELERRREYVEVQEVETFLFLRSKVEVEVDPHGGGFSSLETVVSTLQHSSP